LNKIEKLKQENIINNYSINIIPNIQPNFEYDILEIKTNPKELNLVNKLLEITQLTMLEGILGEFSLIALFIFKLLNVLISNCFKTIIFQRFSFCLSQIIKIGLDKINIVAILWIT